MFNWNDLYFVEHSTVCPVDKHQTREGTDALVFYIYPSSPLFAHPVAASLSGQVESTAYASRHACWR